MLTDYFRNIFFVHQWLLAALALLPLLIAWYWRDNNKTHAAFSVSSVKKFSVAGNKVKLRHLLFILRMLTLAALILALARPQKKIETQKVEGEGVDIVLCMDISGSMGSPDIPPSRMEAAKEVAQDFIRNRPTDRIGLVVFAGEAFTQCPVTADHANLIQQIQNLDSRKLISSQLLKDGTVIGEGLATAVDRLSSAKAKSKIIILLTDGKENAPAERLIDPITALEIAKAKRIRVYAIGIGASPTTIVENTGVAQSKNSAISFIDEVLLTKIAKETGGVFFRAKDKLALQETYKQIGELEKTKVESVINTHYEELFFPLLLAALFFLFTEIFIKYTWLRYFP